MMTGYGDVLESSNYPHPQSSPRHQFQFPHNDSPRQIDHQNQLPSKFASNIATSLSNSMQSNTTIVTPRSNNPYSSYQPIANIPAPKFSKSDIPTESSLRDSGTHQLETNLDSPRSEMSRVSLPESSSELVLGALKNLLDKLKTLEIERDKARREIQQLDKERQWLAFSQSSNVEPTNEISRGRENSESGSSKPLMFEAACNTSENMRENLSKNSDTNHENISFPSPSKNSMAFELRSGHDLNSSPRSFTTSYLPKTSALTTVTDYVFDKSLPKSNSFTYNAVSTPPFENSRLFRSTTNYPVLTGAASGSGSFSSGVFNDFMAAGTPAASGYSGDFGTGRTFTREDNNFRDRKVVNGYSFGSRDAIKRNDLTFDAPNSAKSYSFSSAAVPNTNEHSFATFLNKSINGPNLDRQNDDKLFERSSRRQGGVGAREFVQDLEVNDGYQELREVGKDQEGEKSFSELQNSTQAVELQFRQAEDRCVSLEQQLNSMQRLVDEQKKFTDQINRPSSRSGSTPNNEVTKIAASSKSVIRVSDEKSSVYKNRRSNDTKSEKSSSKSSRSVSPNDSVIERQSDKGRHVSFQNASKSSNRDAKSKEVIKPRSRSLDRLVTNKTSHSGCGHYHAKFSELPFVCGTSTNASHSVNVNLQRVLAALKMHSSACQSAGVTGTLVNNMKPPSGKKLAGKKRRKKSQQRPNSSCSTQSVSEENVTKDATSSGLTTSVRMKKCDFTSESSMRELAFDLYKEFEELAIQHEEINQEREFTNDQKLAVELAREQMVVRKKMEAKQTQIDKVESHLDALKDNAVKKQGSGKRKLKKANSGTRGKTVGSVPKFDSSSELLKNMQKLQSSLRRDDVKWD